MPKQFFIWCLDLFHFLGVLDEVSFSYSIKKDVDGILKEERTYVDQKYTSADHFVNYHSELHVKIFLINFFFLL